MKANNCLSKREHSSLIIFSFTIFCLVLLVFGSQIINSLNNEISQFSGSKGIQTIGGFHFLTFFIFIALLKTKRFLLPSFLTISYAAIFIYGLSIRYDGARLGGEEYSPPVDFLEKIYRAAVEFDYIAAVFISILLFWQISILLRMLIKTMQRKTALP